MTLLYVQNFQTLRIIIARILYRICFQGITVIYGLFVIFSILIFFFFSEKLVKKMKLISIKTVFLRVVLQLYRMWFVLTRIINSFRLKDDEMYQVLVQFCVTLSFRLLTRCVRIQIKRKKNHHPFIVDYCAVVIRHRSGAVLSVHVISRDKIYSTRVPTCKK